MSIKYRVYKYQGARVQNWIVPAGVTQARFEAWGAAGAMASGIWFQNTRTVAGGAGAPAIHFDNNPSNRALGRSYANSAGYAAGTCNVTAGTRFSIAVGGNGQPGFSRIHTDAVIRTGDFVGGAGGWPDGGKGGRGWLATTNLYNASTNVVTYTTSGAFPASASVGDTWLRTDTNIVSRCIVAYASGPNSSKWTQKTRTHTPVAGSSAGGGGGSTSIMTDDEMSSLSARVVVAGGSGGAGGLQCANGPGAWQIATSPTDGTAISPPFGLENQQNIPPIGDTVWLSVVDYFTSGMGIGGLGGGTSPQSSPSNNVDAAQPSGSWASGGAPGGPATTMHAYNSGQATTNASTTGGGGAGTGQSAGRGGVTAYSKPTTAAQPGDTNVNPLASMGGFSYTQGTGGNGADGKPTIADSDWHCGGGGGGGGFHGGGGGGAGYYGGHNYMTFGGGGGGGSNFVMNYFTSVVLLGGARPPAASPRVPGSDGTGGLGGFARITYHQPPVVGWALYPSAFDVTVPVPVTFSFASTGADVYSFDIGYSTNLNATVPDVYTSVLVSAASVVAPYTTHGSTLLSYSFPANMFTSGVPVKFFVRALDADGKPGSADPVRGTGNGDLSAWAISETIQAEPHSAFVPVTITSPVSGSTIAPGTVALGWTVGTQTPLMGYRATLFDASGKMIGDTGYRFGGSRINLATNPGFVAGGPAWTVMGTVPGTFTNGDTTWPGTSGFNGKIVWANNIDGSAMIMSPLFGNKEPGRSYRVMLNVASNTSNDPFVLHASILDSKMNIVREEPIALVTTTAGQYQRLDFHFTLPNNLTSFYVAILASDVSGTKGNSDSTRITYLSDFLVEPGMVSDLGGYFDGSHTAPTVPINGTFETNITGWAAVANATVAQGTTAHGGTKSLDITWTPGVGVGLASVAYTVLGLEPGQQYTVSAWANSATGQATPILTIDNGTSGSANSVSSAAGAADGTYHQITSPTFTVDSTGTLRISIVNNNATTTGWITHIDDVTITGVAVAGAASWVGTANQSMSLLTGVDKTSDLVNLVENSSVNGVTLSVYTLSSLGAQVGFSVGVSEPISLNQSQPQTPTVAMVVDNVHGYMSFTITDPAQRTNLITNPSFETNTTGWAVIGTTTIAQSGAQFNIGTKSMLVTMPAAATAGAAGTSTPFTTGTAAGNLAPNTQYTLSAYVLNTTGVSLQATASGAGVTGTTNGTAVAANAAWQRVSVTFTTSASGAVTLSINNVTTVGGAAQAFYLDAVLLETGATLNPYFDGSVDPIPTTGGGAFWTGTAHGSTSQTWPASSFSVWRTDTATGVTTRVGTNIAVVNRVGVFQDVPASGQAVTYQVDAVSSGGGVTSTTSGTVTTSS